jgi:hypothetical protein
MNQITLAPEFVREHPDLVRVFAHRSLYDARYRQRIRDDFGFFRQHIRPSMLWGWWNEVVATELTEFYKDFVAGKRPKLAICTPPQHGKSWTAVDFVGWVSGRDPNLKTIFASFSDELGMRTNKDLQRIFDDTRFSVHRRHERRIGQPEVRNVNSIWRLIPVFLASVYGGFFRRRTELHCACRACARGPRFPHQAERFETNDLAVRKCRRRNSFPVLEQGDLVCRDRDGHWGLVGGSHRRIGGRRVRPSVLRGTVIAFAAAVAVAYFFQ